MLPYEVRRVLRWFDPRPHGRGFMFELRMAWQRATKGVSTRDTWSFDNYLDEIIPRGLRILRERDIGNPCMIFDEDGSEYSCLDTEDYDWQNADKYEYAYIWPAVLTAMIDGFEAHDRLENGYYVDGEFHLPYHNTPEGIELREEAEFGRKLFLNNYGSLWD